MPKPAALPTWIELTLDRAGDEIRASARGSRGEQIAPRPLGAGRGAAAMGGFADAVRQAAARGKPLAPAVVDDAQAAHGAMLAGEIEPLLAVLHAAAGGPLLVRLMVSDPELQAVPWEALCKPGEALGFWGASPDIHPVRGVATTEPWQPREVRGAVRVLAIAPTDAGGLATLKDALAERIASGEVAWLEPVVGPAARVPGLFDRLRREPVPHVLHFLGHGGQDKGVPVLRLADDDDGDEVWLQVELLAQQLAAGFRGELRLVVLEACEGAKPSAFASAAEILARAGADAVVAHLWPVKTDVARTCSAELYRAVAGADRGGGDVAMAMNEARRAMLGAFGASAEALSPVLYLRGPDGTIFDFAGRKVAPAVAGAGAASPAAASGVDPSLARVLGAPFSLVLGDRWKDDRAALSAFRDRLHKELVKAGDAAPAGLPMSMLTQRYALRRGDDKLGAEFQKAFHSGAEGPPIVAAAARLLGPGVHTTLLRGSWLEESLAEQQKDRTIYVIQPGDEGVMTMKREAGGEWEDLDDPPASVDLEREILVLRPYRGYSAEQVFTRPLLTEDDYLHYLRGLWSALPLDLGNAVLRVVSYRPALVLGMSMLTLHHRRLLESVHARGLPRGSLAVLEPEDGERKLWESGAGLPGKSGVEVVETPAEALVAALLAASGQGGR